MTTFLSLSDDILMLFEQKPGRLILSNDVTLCRAVSLFPCFLSQYSQLLGRFDHLTMSEVGIGIAGKVGQVEKKSKAMVWL